MIYGAHGEIRTPDRLVRSQVLYPAELHARNSFIIFLHVTNEPEVRSLISSPQRFYLALLHLRNLMSVFGRDTIGLNNNNQALLNKIFVKINGGERGIRTLDEAINPILP